MQVFRILAVKVWFGEAECPAWAPAILLYVFRKLRPFFSLFSTAVLLHQIKRVQSSNQFMNLAENM